MLTSFSPYETIACLHTLAKCDMAPPVPWIKEVTKLVLDQVIPSRGDV